MCDAHCEPFAPAHRTRTADLFGVHAVVQVPSAMSDIEQLVDSVLGTVPSALRTVCDRSGILAGLESVGAVDVMMLRSLMEQDYVEVKTAIGGSAKAAFVARLKEAVLEDRPISGATVRRHSFETPLRPCRLENTGILSHA